MAQTNANGIQIEYETHGNANDPALVLVRDLGTQLIDWPEEYINGLVERGFYVVRFDNRDVGLSQKLDEYPVPSPNDIIRDLEAGRAPSVPYTIDDMAADVVGLMDALGIDEAHFVGLSMGGIIAQAMAIDYGGRCISLTTINSGSGAPKLPRPDTELFYALMKEADGDDRETVVKHRVLRGKLTTGERFPIPEETILRRERRAYERCFHRAGRDRQHGALVASGDRSERLSTINVPVLVIHGSEDPLVHYSAGVDTVRKIPHARLELIEGMGHDLPSEALPELVDRIARHAELAVSL